MMKLNWKKSMAAVLAGIMSFGVLSTTLAVPRRGFLAPHGPAAHRAGPRQPQTAAADLAARKRQRSGALGARAPQRQRPQTHVEQFAFDG